MEVRPLRLEDTVLLLAETMLEMLDDELDVLFEFEVEVVVLVEVELSLVCT